MSKKTKWIDLLPKFKSDVPMAALIRTKTGKLLVIDNSKITKAK